ncbi:thiamine ABC transporter substrate binding subunit [Aurantimonas sp. HBX-1]|uniref:thiamine ABC transporter substrate binding subunit n=1 Tax=Aurantimonas sp. HBX-1 TaxID=2906072 RepID=UPI001F25D588|nr:thiamine ABC transporter substrate binding subunit [Aurantimonas sp. HBX-1]UIJ72372.1 thiamine ABC transporter substrate binding subunit [Aurantimonas sp. HBX-1]
MHHSLRRSRLLAAPLVAAGLATFVLPGTASAQAEKPVLTVYTYESFTPEWGPGPKIETAFEAVCGCDLQFVGLDDGVAILNRLKLEGASSDADIALGLTSDLIPEAKATGLFAESGVDLSALSVPTGFADPVFVPFDYSYLAFVYDTETITDPPASLDELVNGDPEQKIVIEDARTSTPGLGLLLWMKSVYGDAAKEKWALLSKRILTVTPGWSEAYGLFTNGEVPIVLSYTTSPAYHMIEEGTERYQAAAFSDGHYLQIEVAAMLANADQPELARRFLAFMLTPAFQSIIPTTNWSLPVIDGIDLPTEFGRLVEVTTPVFVDPETVAANRRAWTQEWLEALGR